MDRGSLERSYSIALRIVSKASHMVTEGFNKAKQIQAKASFSDLVTEFDGKVENYIKGELKKEFPTHQFLGEETATGTLTNDITWILDPIDGTNNFAHNYDECAISLALTHSKEPIIGIICCPMQNKLFSACKDKGAFLNGAPIRTSNNADLEKALIGLEISLGGRSNEILELLLKRSRVCVQKTLGCRSVGCAALGLCYVAAGYWDAYHTEGLATWDVAAGVLIVTEAGGTVTNSQGDKLDLQKPSILATSTSQLTKKLVDLFKNA